MPRKANRWTLLISPDDITNPCKEMFSNILALLKNDTFFNVQSSRETVYGDSLRPSAML